MAALDAVPESRIFYHATENGTSTAPGAFTGIAISPDRTMVAATQPSGRSHLHLGPDRDRPEQRGDDRRGPPAPVVLRPNRTLTFRYDAAPGESLVFAFEGTPSGDATYAPGAGSDPIAAQMQESFGAAPTPAVHDQSAVAYASRLKTAIAVVDSRDGDYYVSLAAPFLASGTITGTIRIINAPLTLATSTPHRAGNAGNVTLAITGTGLSEDTHVSLVSSSGTTLNATRVLELDENRLGATFDLTGAETGCGCYASTTPRSARRARCRPRWRFRPEPVARCRHGSRARQRCAADTVGRS